MQIVEKTMTLEQARLWEEAVGKSVNQLRILLAEGYRREAWRALGYPNWTACLESLAEKYEFSERHAWRLHSANQSEKLLTNGQSAIEIPEAQLRPLAQLDPDQQQEAWSRALEIAPKDHNGNPKVTGKIVEQAVQETNGNGFNYKRDSRRSTIQNVYVPNGRDACQTPAYAIDPLLPYLDRFKTIWEPASGEGYLVEAFYDAGFQVESSDLIDGLNFFEHEPPKWDCIVTNPPYSIWQKWLERCYELGNPFALLLNVEILGTKGAQELFGKYGFEVLLMDKRVDFKMPNKGWDGAGSQFSTAWFTWQLLPRTVVFGKLIKEKQHE